MLTWNEFENAGISTANEAQMSKLKLKLALKKGWLKYNWFVSFLQKYGKCFQ